MKSLALSAALALASATGGAGAITPSEAARLTGAARIVQEMRGEVSQQYWDRARCVAVIPDLKKAALIFGGEYGKGVMSCRSGDGWSAPVFLQLAKGSWGFQAGAEQIDLVLLVMNESGVQKLLQNNVTLGADASVAAGPIGRQGSLGTDAALKAEILAYSRAQGLFAGVNVSGGTLKPDEEANADVFGAGATARTILVLREISAPPQAQALMSALASTSTTAGPAAQTNPPAASSPKTSTGSPQPTAENPAAAPQPAMSDADLRSHLVEIQQTIDRLLAASAPAPVGTTGTTAESARSVSVDRSALVRLRQQIDALMAALDRRR
jgi:lipid-binding SYLF domain-containing protein